jgi:hypothetical protein
MKKTNLFIVGAAKSGTTTIYDHLCDHPDIFMSPIKEPHYFCSDIRRKNFTQLHYKKFDLDLNKYFQEKPLKRHHIAYIDQLDQYEKLFHAGQVKKYLGECSGGYLYSSTAAQSIYEYNADAKIIISLREPVDRAYSHWKMNLANGRENENIPFDKCIFDAFTKADKAWGVAHLYVDLGLYCEQIRRYLDIFPRKNILIVFYRDLMISPQKFMDDIFKFLDLEAIVIDQDKKSNPSRKPKFPMLQSFIRDYRLARFFNRQAVNRIKVLTSSDSFPPLTKTERKKIYDRYFKNDILQLQNELGMDLSSLVID